MNRATILAEYSGRFDALVEVAASLSDLIEDHLNDADHIDQVSARAKDPASFAEKALRKNEDGSAKYSDPFAEIQDQVGARITVFYLDDVRVVSELIGKYFREIEQTDLLPESEWEFGYFGRHWILALPTDVVPSGTDSIVPRFFELQIKTLFQHAWSEANHDLAYKPAKSLTPAQQRKFAFAAAQAWGGDQIFEELRGELLGSQQD